MRNVILSTRRALVALTVAAAALGGCASKSTVTGPQWAPGTLPPNAIGPAAHGPGAPAPSAAPVANDPINGSDVPFMREQARRVLGELVAALPAAQKGLVEGIPLVADDSSEVNAYAACRESGSSLMAITDGLMVIQSHMARAQATDELFGTAKLDAYVRHVAQNRSARPPLGMFDAAQDADGRKVARQHQLFEEQLAFVLGHELAHHYLSHTGCIGHDHGRLTHHDLGRALEDKVPVFNQPNEAAADVAGVNNMLTAGKRRAGYQWTDGGAMLTLRFFLALREASGDEVVFSFEATHPHPAFRMPIVQQTSRMFVATGGLPIPILPTFPLAFPGG